MSKNKTAPSQQAAYWRVTERNDWEGETWYHYFLDEPGVGETLAAVLNKAAAGAEGGADLEDLTHVYVSDDKATALTNLEAGYMQPHWFGELTRAKELEGASPEDLYKGAIRNYGSELWEYPEAGPGDEGRPPGTAC